jgi:hypothetical protein
LLKLTELAASSGLREFKVNLSNFLIAVFCLSTAFITFSSHADCCHPGGADYSETIARERAQAQLLEMENGASILKQLNSICEQVIYSDKQQSQVDIKQPIDVEICRGTLAKALQDVYEDKKR